jgi:hypothetical protein
MGISARRSARSFADVRNPAADWTREGADAFRVQPSPDLFADRQFPFGGSGLRE